MKNSDNHPGNAAELRRQAEVIAREQTARSPENFETQSPEETRRIVHELRVHQIELEMQNEELRRTQMELDAARSRYFDLYDLAPVGYCTISEKGIILEANLTLATMLGASRSAQAKKPFSSFILKEDKDIFYLRCKQLYETGEPQAFDIRMVRKDGTVFWGHLRETAAQDANDEPLCRVVISDITARKQAEEALIESERKLKEYSKSLELMVEDRTREINKALAETEDAFKKIDSILKSVGEGLLVTDIYSRIILMNRAAENLLDVRLSDVINRSLEFAIKDKTVLSRLKTTLSKDVNDIFDFELLKNGSNKPLFLHAKTAVIYDKSGKKTGVTISFHDVTFEREIDRIQNEFISTLAHELRTPLTSIRGFSEILLTRNNIPPSDQKKYLNYINNKSVEMANIINDLLNISRIESGPELELSKEMVNINEIISQLVRFYQDNSKKHSFEVFTSEKPVKIVVDGEKIKLVLKNILINSIKFSPDGGLIKIRGEITGDDYQVTIEDQGIGMTMDQVEQIFHKFYRADASNTALGGTGLGMNIVKNIVVMHGGKIWVNSQPGKGTAVKFTLPLACTE